MSEDDLEEEAHEHRARQSRGLCDSTHMLAKRKFRQSATWGFVNSWTIIKFLNVICTFNERKNWYLLCTPNASCRHIGAINEDARCALNRVTSTRWKFSCLYFEEMKHTLGKL